MINYAKLRRVNVCIGFVFAALGFVSVVANASTYPNARLATLQAAYGNVLGNTSTLTIASGTGTPWSTSAYGLQNATGRVGNFALAQSGTGVVMGGTVKTPLGATGKVVDAVVKAPITRAGFARAVGGLLTGPVGATALMVAVPLVSDWFAQGKVKPNPNAADYPEKPWIMEQPSDGYQYQIANITDWMASYQAVCNAFQARVMSDFAKSGRTSISIAYPGATKSSCWFTVNSRQPSGTLDSDYFEGIIAFRTSSYVDNLPASMDDVAQYMDRPEAPILTPRIVEQAITGAGIDPFGAAGPDESVSGPSSVPGASRRVVTPVQLDPGTTTPSAPGAPNTQPGTRTETSTDTHNVSYRDNKVTYNTTTINNTTITNNITGDTVTTNNNTTETNDDSKAEDKPDLCEKNPDILACKKPDFDTPDGTIPKSTKDISFQPENLFGGGSCPANKVMTLHTGQVVTVWDWETTCSGIMKMRYVILILAAMTALAIVVGGTKS